MKDCLTLLTKQIVESIEIDVDKFQVYSEIDSLPRNMENIEFQSDYLVCIWVKSSDTAIAKEHYESFLHKSVSIIKTRHHDILYWFEGFGRKQTIEKTKGEHSRLIGKEELQVDSLKNSSILPTWLQQSIFDKHQGQYAPDHKRYEKNLNLSENELKVYLGTYFPRSYGECFCVFDNIFENKHYWKLATKEEISILDIGSGTGGNLMGLLVAINKYSIAVKNVNILALDGNSNALIVLRNIVDEFANKATFTINLTTKWQSIHSTKDLEWITDSKYDFIMSFKMGCELIAEGSTDIYYDLTTFSLPRLSEVGLFFLLDVTTKVGITYNPILMNLQVNRAINQLNGFKTLIPISCGEFEKECTGNCFTQRTFNITHSKKKNDKTKVTYRIMTNSIFANKINVFDNNCSYINTFEKDDNTKYCPKCKGNIVKDNYKI